MQRSIPCLCGLLLAFSALFALPEQVNAEATNTFGLGLSGAKPGQQMEYRVSEDKIFAAISWIGELFVIVEKQVLILMGFYVGSDTEETSAPSDPLPKPDDPGDDDGDDDDD